LSTLTRLTDRRLPRSLAYETHITFTGEAKFTEAGVLLARSSKRRFITPSLSGTP
jgi:hypothetical protein